MLGRLGVERASEVLDRLLASQFHADAWEPYPDVEPMLRAVRAMGVRIGIVSDWGSNLRGIIAGLELDRYLDFVLAVRRGRRGEAQSRLLPAWPRTGGVAPDEALMVGDSYRADVRGAWAPGWTPSGSTAPRASASRPTTSPRRPTCASSARSTRCRTSCATAGRCRAATWLDPSPPLA